MCLLSDLHRLIVPNVKYVRGLWGWGSIPKFSQDPREQGRKGVLGSGFPGAGGPVVRAVTRDEWLSQGQEQRELALPLAALWFFWI